MDHPDRIISSYSPPAHREESDEEDPVAERAAARIRQVYPFWGENTITLKPADLKYPFNTRESLRPSGQRDFDRPRQNFAKIESPLEQLRADNAKKENTLRIAIDGLRLNYGKKWKASAPRAGLISGLQGRLRKILKESGEIEREREEAKRHEAVLRELLHEIEIER